MTVRLPNPPQTYDPRDQAELRRALESVLRQVTEVGQTIDPSRALNNFRVTSETDSTITFAWSRGANVKDVWVNHLLVNAPVTGDPWATVDPLVPSVKLGVADTLTLDKPTAGQQRWAQFVPRMADLTAGPIVRRTIDPAAGAVTGHIKADVTNSTADLTVTVSGAKADFPVACEVHEHTPDSAPIATFTVTGNATRTKAQLAALGGRALPLRQVERWWLKMTNAAGVETWAGPTAADRDSLPGAVVTDTGNQLRIDYDDDTDVVQVIVPGGRTWTRTVARGGGSLTYSVGLALDNSSGAEGALGTDEVRDGYVVRAQGGGTWVTLWRGALYGPTAPFSTVELTVSVVGSQATVTARATGGTGAFPLTAYISEGDPSAVIASGTISFSGGSISTSARTLPLRQVQRWWCQTIDAHGTSVWYGPAAADRDSLPDVMVESTQAQPGVAPSLVMVFDDDCDQIRVTVPSGGVITYSTPPGSNAVPKVYHVGDVLDSGVDPALVPDEVRGTYVVTALGGGVWRECWRGSMYGPNKAFLQPHWDVAPVPFADHYVFNWTVNDWGSATSGHVDANIDGITTGGVSSGLSVARLSTDRTVQLIATNADGITSTRSFTIPATVTSSGGGGPAGPAFSALSLTVNYSGGTVVLSWGFSGAGYTYDVWFLDPASNGTLWVQTASGQSNTSYSYVSGADLRVNGGNAETIKAYVEASDGVNAVKSATKSIFVHYGAPSGGGV